MALLSRIEVSDNDIRQDYLEGKVEFYDGYLLSLSEINYLTKNRKS